MLQLTWASKMSGDKLVSIAGAAEYAEESVVAIG